MRKREIERRLREAREGEAACLACIAAHGPHAQIEANARWWRGRVVELEGQLDPLFMGIFPGGMSYANRRVEEHGDYKRLAFLAWHTLKLKVQADCPADLRAKIEAHARGLQARIGEVYSGHVLGGAVSAKRCQNSEPGWYNQEHGKPATWIAQRADGFTMAFCGQCKDDGHERHGFARWLRCEDVPGLASAQ